MADDIPRRNIAVIRELPMAAATAEDLRQFSGDRSALRDLLANMPTRASLTETIDVIIDHTPRCLLPQLLEAVKEVNPKQHDRFAPQLCILIQAEGKSQSTLTVPEESKSQSQITLTVLMTGLPIQVIR